MKCPHLECTVSHLASQLDERLELSVAKPASAKPPDPLQPAAAAVAAAADNACSSAPRAPPSPLRRFLEGHPSLFKLQAAAAAVPGPGGGSREARLLRQEGRASRASQAAAAAAAAGGRVVVSDLKELQAPWTYAGCGRTSSVYTAVHSPSGVTVAVKEVHARSPERRDVFVSELETLILLPMHPGVVALYVSLGMRYFLGKEILSSMFSATQRVQPSAISD
jgi:hypothetical protein